MVKDIVPELLDAIDNDYERLFNKSKKIVALTGKLEKGTAGYLDAYSYAVEVGNIRAKAFKRCINNSVLPDGKMYYNIAERVINNTLPVDYKLVADYASEVQSICNKKSKINLKSQKVRLDQSRLDGIINKLSNGEDFDSVAWILDEPIKTFTQGIVDDTIKGNMSFQNKAGVKTTCVRTSEYKCCEWCESLAGSYDYSEVSGKSDVFARHDNCRCTIEYQNHRLTAGSRNFR